MAGRGIRKKVRIYVRGCRCDVSYSRRQDGGLCAIWKDVVGIRALSPLSTRSLDASKYGLELEVDGGSGGC